MKRLNIEVFEVGNGFIVRRPVHDRGMASDGSDTWVAPNFRALTKLLRSMTDRGTKNLGHMTKKLGDE